MTDQAMTTNADATRVLPAVRKISPRDLVDALARGFDDFWAMPTHVVFLCVIYPVVGMIVASITLGYELMPMFYPMAAGFALVGPFAAVHLYALSRRREQGLETRWSHAFDLLQGESFRPLAVLGIALLVIFGLWIAAAQAIYIAYFGYAAPESIDSFVREVFATEAGRRMILIGNGVGFLFALASFCLSVVAFPLLIDRDIGAVAAALTSIKVVLRNPLTMALWGLIVAVALLIGSLPLFIGLAIVLPVLGHATWHLYRKTVVADGPPRKVHEKPSRPRRYAAEFPAALFPTSTK